MTQEPLPNESQLPHEVRLRIDRVVADYESAWHADANLAQVDLSDWDERDRAYVVRALLQCDRELRARRDLDCSEAFYLQKYPEFADAIRAEFSLDAWEPTQDFSPTPGQHKKQSTAECFATGTVLADRYRIVRLLGRGGMGVVYQAEDLQLDGEFKALKVVPPDLAHDERYLHKLHNEVKVALQVTHPNVCRIHDIVRCEQPGLEMPMALLVMEYVEGEDLAGKLQRKGPITTDLSFEQSMEIARQLCEGLTAAHQQGIYHRDLKPANIMLDANGLVRIMDFGLATKVYEAQSAPERAGSLGYSAPEQLERGESSEKSDIYSLAVVLYELFTKRRAFVFTSLEELEDKQRGIDLTPPWTYVPSLGRDRDRALMECLDPDPAKRPSMLAFGYKLFGSTFLDDWRRTTRRELPEEVEQEIEPTKPLLPKTGLWLLLATVAALVLALVLQEPVTWVGATSLPNQPTELKHEAERWIREFGYSRPQDRPEDFAYGFAYQKELRVHLLKHDTSENRWEPLLKGQPPGIVFWYRQSPETLTPQVWRPPGRRFSQMISQENPPPTLTGMVGLRLDPEGKLVSFYAVAREDDMAAVELADDWWTSTLSPERIGLDLSTIEPSSKQLGSIVFPHDKSRVWESSYPDTKRPIRIEAAAYRGRLVYFKVTVKNVEVSEATNSGVIPFVMFYWTTVLIAGVVAVRNLRSGRADWKGALRIMVALAACFLVAWLFGADHRPSFLHEHRLFSRELEAALGSILFSVTCYLAVESYVRRYWPDCLTSWSRVLEGKYRDPLVGRDILIGVCAAVGYEAAQMTLWFVGNYFAWLPPVLHSTKYLHLLLGGTQILSHFGAIAGHMFFMGLMFLTFLLILREVLKHDTATALAFVALISVMLISYLLDDDIYFSEFSLTWVTVALFAVLVWYLLTRYGWFATLVLFVVNGLILYTPLTLNPDKFYFGQSLFVAGIVVGLAAFGYYVGVGGPRKIGGTQNWTGLTSW